MIRHRQKDEHNAFFDEPQGSSIYIIIQTICIDTRHVHQEPNTKRAPSERVFALCCTVNTQLCYIDFAYQVKKYIECTEIFLTDYRRTNIIQSIIAKRFGDAAGTFCA